MHTTPHNIKLDLINAGNVKYLYITAMNRYSLLFVPWGRLGDIIIKYFQYSCRQVASLSPRVNPFIAINELACSRRQ